jgi:hypothetical protein
MRPMRSSIPIAVLISLAACGSPSAQGQPGDAAPIVDAAIAIDAGFDPPARGFQIAAPSVDVMPGADVTFCYYFHTPNTGDLAIQKWASRMSAGGHHMILFFTASDLQTPGTLSTTRCGYGANAPGPIWAYAAQTPAAEAALPADDGRGVPVAQTVRAGQSGFLLMHFINSTDAVIRAHIELNAYAYDAGTAVTVAAPYVSYEDRINLPAAASAATPTTGSWSGNCSVPVNARFFVVTTQTHKQAVRAVIKDGATTVFTAATWEHPGEQRWPTAPFYTFASGKLTYQCDFSNPNGYPITAGDNMATQEACIAIGYYVPAATAVIG